MKQYAIITTLALSLLAFDLKAQMASPPATAEGEIDGTKVTINYSAPSARGREIMGGLVPFGKVWRTGANKATAFEIDKDVKVEGQDLKAGKYGLFTIPGEDSWTIIFSTNWEQWGAFNYNKDEDVLRVEVKPAEIEKFIETFTITVRESAVVMEWANTSVAFAIK